MTSYATPGDWAARTGQPVPTAPVELAQLVDRLDAASVKVRRLVRFSTFANVAGVPTDPGVATALQQATLDQVLYATATDPDGFGLGEPAITVGPVTLGATPGAAGGAGGGIAPRAIERLIDAGLISTTVGYL